MALISALVAIVVALPSLWGGLVGDEEQGDVRRGLFEELQESVRGGGVHLVHRVDDRHAPPAICGRQREKAFHLAYFVDRNHILQLSLFFIIKGKSRGVCF